MYIKLFALITFSVFVVNAQSNTCPIVPDGMINVSSLEWAIRNELIKVEIDDYHVSELQTAISWDLFSGQLEIASDDKQLEALRLIDRLNMEDDFLIENSASYLSLSPFELSDYALLVSGTPRTVFAVNTSTLEKQALGQVTDNLSNLTIFWYEVDRAIIVVEPLYGSGFGLYEVSIGDSNFTDLTLILDYLPQRPDINVDGALLAVYSTDLLRMSILDLNNRSVVKEFSISNQLLQNTNPVWSEDGKFIYYWGFDDSLTDYVVYKLDLGTGNTEPVVTVDSIINLESWLIIPNEKILIFSDGSLHIQCYS